MPMRENPAVSWRFNGGWQEQERFNFTFDFAVRSFGFGSMWYVWDPDCGQWLLAKVCADCGCTSGTGFE